MSHWSPEYQGGEWLDGATGPMVGARFKGRNKERGKGVGVGLDRARSCTRSGPLCGLWAILPTPPPLAL